MAVYLPNSSICNNRYLYKFDEMELYQLTKEGFDCFIRIVIVLFTWHPFIFMTKIGHCGGAWWSVRFITGGRVFELHSDHDLVKPKASTEIVFCAIV